MRRLLLLRHAKAERPHQSGRDRDRVLTQRGRDDAARAGAFVVRHGLIPDLVVVSPSARTRETWDFAAAAFADAPEPVFDERIYEAEAQMLLEVIAETGPEVASLLLVGHNPGMQELAALLIASGDLEARQRLNENFPTAALAVIDFALPDWSRLHPKSGRLERFVDRHSLAAATD
jgi:phosphohistidine phosphatase